MSSRTNEVKPEWPIKTVEELVNENTLDKPLDGNHGGIHPKSTDYVQEGIPFIMANDLVNNKINFENCKYITEEQAIGLKKGKAIEGDVLLTHKATMGRTAIVVNAPSDYIVLTPQVTYYRILNKGVLNNSFLKYYFDSKDFQTLLNAWAQGGSTRSYLGITAQLKLPIRIPTLNEQKSIAHILSTLDDKIEVNNQINKTLENMAQAIFKQWFVDFEFPNEDGEPYKSSGGEMIESELGMIPKGWEVEEIENISDIQNGFAFKAPEYVDEGVKVLRTLNIGNDGYFNNTDIVFLPQSYKSEKYEKYYFEEFDVALVMVGASIGKIGMILKNTAGGLQNQNMWRFRRKEKRVSQIFIYYTVKQAQNISKNWSTGSARDFYRKDSFRKIKVILPEKRIMDLFEKITKPIFQNISNHACENDELISMRDGLLPKLMSGEIRVPLDEEGAAS